MKLYHATSVENIENIIECGLEPNISNKITDSEERVEEEGIFGFIDKESAYDFGRDNFGEFAIVIFEADVADLENDPEYDGVAKFYKTSRNMEVELLND